MSGFWISSAKFQRCDGYMFNFRCLPNTSSTKNVISLDADKRNGMDITINGNISLRDASSKEMKVEGMCMVKMRATSIYKKPNMRGKFTMMEALIYSLRETKSLCHGMHLSDFVWCIRGSQKLRR